MSVTILMAIGWVAIAMIVLALVSGRVMTGALRAKYYTRVDDPRQYYGHLIAYGVIAVLIFTFA